MKCIYIAGRYRGPNLSAIEANIQAAKAFMRPIAELGMLPVCVHSMEGVALHDCQQADRGQFWVDATLELLRRCDGVVLVPGWGQSDGTLGELKEARRLHLPVWEAAFLAGPVQYPAAAHTWVPFSGSRGLNIAAYFRGDK